MSITYHVAKHGNDWSVGSEDQPFLSINKAAQVMVEGDTVVVHEGVYREWVNPINGGSSDRCRITYKAAEGEKVIITGAESIKGWKALGNGVWQCRIPNSTFGDYNPYQQNIEGDWFLWPKDKPKHTGEVYLNGDALYETSDLQQVYTSEVSTSIYFYKEGRTIDLAKETQYVQLPNKALTQYKWYVEVEDTDTVLYAQFGTYDPNQENVEVNVRKSCFTPKQTGINYITVKGFEIIQAATPFAPPTAEQVGAIGPHWSKGWIIEDNTVRYSKCSGISLGKDYTTGHNESTRFNIRAAYQGQLESVFRALQKGWNKETVGSHIVRNNTVCDCGQAGIVGHMGCVFSEIHHNHIYNIGNRYEFFGWEVAGIKLHAPIDTWVHHNYIHDTDLGMWMDWQTQGTRITGNILHRNNRDFVVEVSHGPYIVENNIFASQGSMGIVSQGGAFIHNIVCNTINTGQVLERATPYHVKHSTLVAGYSMVYGNDDRWLNNIFIGNGGDAAAKWGTAGYNGAPVSEEEYLGRVHTERDDDLEKFIEQLQPVWINGNVYYNGASGFDREVVQHSNTNWEPQLKIEEEGDSVYLLIRVDGGMFDLHTQIQSTQTLGTVRIVASEFEGFEGEMITFDDDLLGQNRSHTPCPGPFETIQPGYNKIKIWPLQ